MENQLDLLRQTNDRKTLEAKENHQRIQKQLDEEDDSLTEQHKEALRKKQEYLRKAREQDRELDRIAVERSANVKTRAKFQANFDKQNYRIHKEEIKIKKAEKKLDKIKDSLSEVRSIADYYRGQQQPTNPRQFNQATDNIENGLAKLYKIKELTDEGNEYLGLYVGKKFVPKPIKTNKIPEEACRKWDLVKRNKKNNNNKRIRQSNSTEFPAQRNRRTDNSNNSTSNNRAIYLRNNAGFPAADIRERNREVANDRVDDEENNQDRVRRHEEDEGDDAN